jgi:hypothetical protein
VLNGKRCSRRRRDASLVTSGESPDLSVLSPYREGLRTCIHKGECVRVLRCSVLTGKVCVRVFIRVSVCAYCGAQSLQGRFAYVYS